MKKKERKEDYFPRNKHISDGHCKNKPSYTGVIYITLRASSSCFQHTAPRSLAPTTSMAQLLPGGLNSSLGGNKSESTKNPCSRKRGLQKHAGAELCKCSSRSQLSAMLHCDVTIATPRIQPRESLYLRSPAPCLETYSVL